ncbi:peroxisomal d3,d2-enoyl-CoA isomerase [Dothidotthia symphoricarpi CBS 119687]|uniref:Peroxisomal d3,d2-enoyl-CoA isomerase n=1 Tax=Dothidotthia symphoricarpi CBS 119687 TaxID=1392245 RepID=A0A6A6AJU7_9PLEO|nr:peroxisomal d3,d2-enoyl-CoA isomerase [Dothidotthia symphoricarpi CBS 119687]KAF2132080.1 peroxisomal d3,d2-enoyl-CoA isomerase [Dothidotthia symphoricarpi CBS 119687]
MTSTADYSDIKFEIKNKIGIITFNRPKALNSFGGNMVPDIIAALRVLNEHPETIFTVITGEGRFFCAGADVKALGSDTVLYKNVGEKKIALTGRFTSALELLRSMIDHKKVLILALNGPAVGAGAAWFPGIADIVLASSTAWLQCPFSALALVPENGSALSFAQHIGIHRANDFLMFGRKLSAQELLDAGMYNYVWDATGDAFQTKVVEFLAGQLEVNDGKSMMEMKRLQNAPIRDARMIAVVNSIDALAERFVEDAPTKRFEAKKKAMEEKSKGKSKL